jgi:hypothetical protein
VPLSEQHLAQVAAELVLLLRFAPRLNCSRTMHGAIHRAVPKNRLAR